MTRRVAALGTALLVISAALGPLALPAEAGDGEPEPSFGDGGTAGTILQPGYGTHQAFAAGANGRFLTLATAQQGNSLSVHLARWTSGGALDETFGTGGVVAVPHSGHAIDVVELGDGSVLALLRLGSWQYVALHLYRFTVDGDLDTTWGTDGVARGPQGKLALPRDLALQGDRVLVAAELEGAPALLRYTSGGVLDSTFDGDGALPLPHLTGMQGGGVEVLDSGRILVAGGSSTASVATVRLLSTGVVDTTYAGDGSTDFQPHPHFAVRERTIHPSGAVALSALYRDSSGCVDPPFTPCDPPAYLGLGRLRADGTPDTSAFPGGMAVIEIEGGPFATEFVPPVMLTDDGFLLAGWQDLVGPVVVRLTPTGQFDPAFGDGGAAWIDHDGVGYDLALTDDGIALGGFFEVNETISEPEQAGAFVTLLQDPPAPIARSISSACAGAPPAGFTDVAATSPHRLAIDCVAWWEVARGQADGSYRPTAEVSRGAMATFIANVILASGGSLPESPPDQFNDDDGSVHEASINRLHAAGVVSGRPDGTFDPSGLVTRAQMATFLVRAFVYRTGGELTSPHDWFVDDSGSPHEAAINQAAGAGIASGLPSGLYGSGGAVRRDQMASFVARLLDLLVDEGVTTPPT